MAWSDGDGVVECSKVANIRGVVTGNFWKDIGWGFALGATWGVGKCICKRRPQEWGRYVARYGGEGTEFVGMLSYFTKKNEIDHPYATILFTVAVYEICERYIPIYRKLAQGNILAGPKSPMAWGVGLCLIHGATNMILDKQKEKKQQLKIRQQAVKHCTPEL